MMQRLKENKVSAASSNNVSEINSLSIASSLPDHHDLTRSNRVLDQSAQNTTHNNYNNVSYFHHTESTVGADNTTVKADYLFNDFGQMEASAIIDSSCSRVDIS